MLHFVVFYILDSIFLIKTADFREATDKGRVCSSWFARQKVNERLARLRASARMLISSVLRRRNTGRKDESAVPGLGHGEHSHSVSVVSLSAPGIEMVENPVCSDDLNLDRPCL